jgi:hypothetical protein
MSDPSPVGHSPASQSQKLPIVKLQRLGNWQRLAIAFAIAGLSDVLSAWLEFVPPLQWALDIVTAGLLFLVLGRQWLLLPGLIAEAIPGLAVLPFWMFVVGSIALWGKIQSDAKSPPPV